jgi:hypothetical protein
LVVGRAKKESPSESFFPSHWLVLPPALIRVLRDG